ncbi:hypothetical protein LEP1GSC203_2213 [Leptospira terpstrae serovar Hualin str. LT 11-33 = ATCC 700639]|uniref:Uncharacterized protein n=1 Tax=Leptospira terpstrae serovar Hualin str. LT 11-33 = ATCC 700639 TaxID=1257025 RepID=N1VUU4_9LEPT|nr:hypothetical protein LEP1GSC203_2213 [Leptospira terpstrae serovar Hualin str. LT 11-33 = ATCC 700639]
MNHLEFDSGGLIESKYTDVLFESYLRLVYILKINFHLFGSTSDFFIPTSFYEK